jgi:PleD family two-component response regulator
MSEPSPVTRILLAEDDPHIREIVALQLSIAGYTAIEAPDGLAALERAGEELPDLALLDVMMPGLDGYEVCRRLRASYRTRHIPIIFLTAKASLDDKLSGLGDGANDYITKPFEMNELLSRVRNALEWSRQQRSASPLTGLPGNLSIDAEVRRRLDAHQPFALLSVDIDSFKSFNDRYGYARGDDTIRTLARILEEAVQRPGVREAFVGHIGGDDLVVLCHPGDAEDVADRIVAEFDRAVPGMYDPADCEQGFVEVLNRRHVTERFPLMAVTIALVSTERYAITHQAELNDLASELKQHGKSITGSVVIGDRRTRSDSQEDTPRRVA